MFRFSRNFEYALIALKHIASKKNKKISTAREISLQYGLSFNLMARILLILKKANIITSIQGTKGGYSLKIDLGKLSIFDLMQIIAGNSIFLTNCLANNKETRAKCSIKPEKCNISGSVKHIQMKVDNFIKDITIKEAIGI